MSNDNLKKFFENNRDAFDGQAPADGVWKRIERALFGAREVSLWNSISVWRAAALILLGLSVYQYASSRITGKSTEGDLAAQQEFRDVESYYAAEISQKAALIRNEGPFLDDIFTQDMQKLEAMHAVLSEELKKHPSQKVKDALVLNMLVRIDLLNQQLQRLEESRSENSSVTGVGT